jgi:aminoglycoside 3-N-acetyltransferase
MLKFHHLQAGLRQLELSPDTAVIAHASLSSFGEVQGGAATVVAALLSAFGSLLMPAFTYQTMVTPLVGPQDNALEYGRARFANRQVQLFNPQLPADRLMGAVAESLRLHTQAQRSSHPILSFTGVRAASILDSQTLAEPLAPIGRLAEAGGWVLLIGVDHTTNTSLHFAERLAGRKQFLRWAATTQGIRQVRISSSRLQAIPLDHLLSTARALIAADPLALLCQKDYCGRCAAVRSSVQ